MFRTILITAMTGLGITFYGMGGNTSAEQRSCCQSGCNCCIVCVEQGCGACPGCQAGCCPMCEDCQACCNAK